MFSIPFDVEREITVNKPVEEVFAHLGNFAHWSTWSPWIIQEPSCPVTVTGQAGQINHKQAWNGERIGSGNMSIIESVKNELIAYDLVFLSPWKSESKTQFRFKTTKDEQGNAATVVSWAMQGTLPIFLFFMKKMMNVFVGGDYERGLKMFKELIETGTVSSKVDISGITEQSGFYYIGIRKQGRNDKIAEFIGPAFEDLYARELPQPDMVLTVSEKFDMVKKECTLVAAFAYKQAPDIVVAEDMVSGEVPTHKALEIMHIGAYGHLANGWATLMNYMRFAKLKANKKIKEYEVYLNDPQNTAAKDLETAIYAPVK